LVHHYNRGWTQIIVDGASSGGNISDVVWRGLILQQDLPERPAQDITVKLFYAEKVTLSFKGIRYLVSNPRVDSALSRRRKREGDILGYDDLGERDQLGKRPYYTEEYRAQDTWLPRIRSAQRSQALVDKIQKARKREPVSKEAKELIMDSSTEDSRGENPSRSYC